MNLEGRQELIVKDIKLNYYEQGEGEILLFIHGNGINGMDSRIFKKMYDHFSKKFKVIAVDSRGQGLSEEGNKHYSLNLLADDLIEFCKVKNIKKVTLIGYSDGANIALIIAKKAKKLVNQLVLISGNYKVNGVQWWFRASLKVYKVILILGSKLFKSLIKKIWLMDLMLKDTGITENDLKKIDIPTLVLCAKFDVVYRQHTLSIKKNIKNSILKIIKYCDHKTIIDKDLSISEIDKFLAKQKENKLAA